MKNQFFTLILFCILFASLGTYAQNGCAISIKGGTNVSNFYGVDNVFDTKSRLGFAGGINTQWLPTTHFSLIFETNFMPMGMRVKDDLNNYKLRNRYIQFVLKPRYYINEESYWSGPPGFYIDAGPYVSYLFSSIATGNLNGIEYERVNTKNDYENWDYGISMVAGVSGLKLLYIEFNYNLGLAKISNNLDIKNNSWNISFMFYLVGIYKNKIENKLEMDSFWF